MRAVVYLFTFLVLTSTCFAHSRTTRACWEVPHPVGTRGATDYEYLGHSENQRAVVIERVNGIPTVATENSEVCVDPTYAPSNMGAYIRVNGEYISISSKTHYLSDGGNFRPIEDGETGTHIRIGGSYQSIGQRYLIQTAAVCRVKELTVRSATEYYSHRHTAGACPPKVHEGPPVEIQEPITPPVITPPVVVTPPVITPPVVVTPPVITPPVVVTPIVNTPVGNNPVVVTPVVTRGGVTPVAATPGVVAIAEIPVTPGALSPVAPIAPVVRTFVNDLFVTEYMIADWSVWIPVLATWIELYNPNTVPVNLQDYVFEYAVWNNVSKEHEKISITLTEFSIPAQTAIILTNKIVTFPSSIGGIDPETQVYNLDIPNRVLKKGWILKDPDEKIIDQRGTFFEADFNPYKPPHIDKARSSFKTYLSVEPEERYHYGNFNDIGDPGYYEAVPAAPSRPLLKQIVIWAELRK